jgi:anti-anti-sigma factor
MAKQAFHLELIRSGCGDLLLLRCLGPLTAGHGAERQVWASLLESPDRADLVLDLSGVTDLDAAGIGMLAELRSAVHRRAGSLQLMEAGRRVKTMLRVTGVADLLDRPAAPVRVIPFRCRAHRPFVNALMPPAAAAV